MVTERQVLFGISDMWRTEWVIHCRSSLILPFLLLTQVLAGCGGGTSVAVCASTGPNNDFCSGFGGPGGGSQTRAAASVEALDVPAGLYSLDRTVDRPFVDGVVLRVTWAELEPEPGHYAFARIADIVTAAAQLGQKVTLVMQLDILPEWLRSRDPAAGSQHSMLTTLSRLVDTLGGFEVDGIFLRNHNAISLAGIAGYESTGAALETVIDIWRATFPRIPVALETVNIPASSESRLPSGVSWLYRNLSTESAAQLARMDSEPPVLLHACGAWVEQEAWPDCTWSESDNPDAALAYAAQQYGASYFEFHAADLESVGYYSQFEYWSSVIKARQ